MINETQQRICFATEQQLSDAAAVLARARIGFRYLFAGHDGHALIVERADLPWTFERLLHATVALRTSPARNPDPTVSP